MTPPPIDPQLLKSQKNVIVKMCFHPQQYNLRPFDVNRLEGLLNLLDIISDNYQTTIINPKPLK